MREPRFLSVTEVLRLHRTQVTQHGGTPGIHSPEMLLSAMAMPKQEFSGQYLHETLYDMAAAYLFHITQNHPFKDRNEHVGATAAVVFLTLNGIRLYADEEEFTLLLRQVIAGDAEKGDIARFFRDNSQEPESLNDFYS